MNTWMMIVMLAALGLTMAVTVAVPEMSRPTLPLGGECSQRSRR